MTEADGMTKGKIFWWHPLVNLNYFTYSVDLVTVTAGNHIGTSAIAWGGRLSTIVTMKPENKKPGRPRSKDRHKPGRQVRIRQALIVLVDKLAERNATTPPEEINRLVREGLERAGLWPPAGISDDEP